MGKGTIKSGGAGGYYTIDLVRDVSGVQGRIAALENDLLDLASQITDSEAVEAEKLSDLNDAKSHLDDLITEYKDLLDNPKECVQCQEGVECMLCPSPSCSYCEASDKWKIGNRPCIYDTLEDCQAELPDSLYKFGEGGNCLYQTLQECQQSNPNWKYGEDGDCKYGTKKECQDDNNPIKKMDEIAAAAKEAQGKSKEWQFARNQTRLLKLIKAHKEDQKTALEGVDATVEVSAWCADLTEDLTGEVGTAEIPNERTAVLIRPGFGGRATYSASRDGILVPSQGQSKEAVVWNWAMRPGWQRWGPTYRGATITAIDGSSCSITLDDATSSDQGLNANPAASFDGVAIEYMDCNGGAFAVDDHVLVQFVSQDRTAPKVIGFIDNPQPCVTGYFVCVPAAQEAPVGWGDPFIDGGGTPINPPLGTAGTYPTYPTYAESVIRGTSTQVYAHLRKGDDYGGIFTQQLLRTTAYGFYDWHGDSQGDTLSINCDDGNRYWGFGTVRDTEIFYRGFKLCDAYNSQKVVGAARATYSSTEYLYAVFLKNDSADPIDETFEVWRRVWQATAYANDNAYNAITEPLGWEYLGDVAPPDYAGYVPAASGTPRMDQVDATESGQIGGVAFAPDGKSFVVLYRLVDTGSGGTSYDVWLAGYIEVTFNAAGDTPSVGSMQWNPISQGAGWDYLVALDYDRAGALVKMFWELEYQSSSDRRSAVRIVGGDYDFYLLDHSDYFSSGYGYTALWYGLDLRFGNAIGQFYKWDDSGPSIDEVFGELVLEDGALSSTDLVERGDGVTSTPTADGSFHDIGADYADIAVAWCFPWAMEAGAPRPFNGLKCDYHGNMLSSYSCDWTLIESHAAHGPGPPTANGYRNRLSGQSGLEAFLSLDSYTNPALLFLGVI